MTEQLAQSWWLILLSVSSGVLGQTALKLGVSGPGASEASNGVASLLLMILRSPLVL